MGTDNRFALGLAALVAALVLALGAAACGSDDGGDDKGSATAAGDGQDDAGGDGKSTVTGPVPDAYLLFSKAIIKGDGKAACASMSKSAQRRFAQGAQCEVAMDNAIGGAEWSENRPYVVEVEEKGRETIAWVKTKNSETYPIPFVMEDGEWKVNGGFGADAQPQSTRGDGTIPDPDSAKAKKGDG